MKNCVEVGVMVRWHDVNIQVSERLLEHSKFARDNMHTDREESYHKLLHLFFQTKESKLEINNFTRKVLYNTE
jgi:hypothetical protein